MKKILIKTGDGYEIAATLYEPTGAPSKAVIVVCAMGVPQRFYQAFCEWLAEKGCVAMTFDYRGMGESRRGSLRGLAADVMTWAEIDSAAALSHLAAITDDLPISWLGHSLGGQTFGFTLAAVESAVAKRVTRVSYLAAGAGYWRENAAPTKRKSWVFWFVLGPLLTPLFGYWPGGRLGIVGDLPRGVFWQWRAWCLNREYAVGVLPPKYRAAARDVSVPIHCISFTDDEMMSFENIESLKSIYSSQSLTAKRFTPNELGVARVGHFGAFRSQLRESLWERHVWPSL